MKSRSIYFFCRCEKLNCSIYRIIIYHFDKSFIILVQNITETTFGNLLRIQEQGIEFLLISVRSYNDDEINRKIENSNLNFMWIKEE